MKYLTRVRVAIFENLKIKRRTTMPLFKDINGRQFLEDYNGVELFKLYTPKIAKLPKLTYKLYYDSPTTAVVEKCLKLGRCTADEAAALEKAFNDKYGAL